jgi:hypothetical protein
MGGVTPGAGVTRTVNISGGNVNVTGTASTHRGGRLVDYNLTGGNTTFAGVFALDTSTMDIGTAPGGATSATAKFGTYRNGSGTTTISGGSATFAAVNDAGNQAGTVNMSGGTVNVTGNYNITNGTPGSGVAGALNLTGANATFNTVTTGGNASAPNSTLYISGGAVTIPTLTLSTTSVLKTDNAISLGSNITIGNAAVNVNSGSLALTGGIIVPSGGRTLTKTGAGTLNLDNTWTFSATPGASTLNVDAGTTNFNTEVPAGGNLTVNANSTTNFAANARLAALNVGADDTATVINDGSFKRVVNADAINIDAAGRLDLKNNKLVTNTPVGTFSGGAYDGVHGEVQQAYHSGAWDRPGLMTSEPNAGPTVGTTTIGVASAQQILFIEPTATGTAFGQSVTGTTTLAMYTYAGDLNFDGRVDAQDYGIIDNWVQFPGTNGYANGDINYDGVIDAADYGIIDNTIQLQGAPIPGYNATYPSAPVAGSSAGALSGVTAVPEPAALGVIAVAAAGLIGRRRRTR